MRLLTPVARCVVAAALLAVSAALCAEPIGFSVNSRGNFSNPDQVNALWRINLATGHAEYVGWTAYLDLEALAMHPDGTLYGADDESKTIVRVSKVTGLGVPVGGAANSHNMGVPLGQAKDFGMAFDCAGSAFAVSDVTRTLFSVNMSNGRLTVIGSQGSLGSPITDLAIRGNEAFGIGVGSAGGGSAAAPNLYRIDLSNGSSQLVGPLGSAVAPYNNAGLDFDADGVLWAITDRRAVAGGGDNPSQILRIDTATGQAELVAESIVGLESLAIGPPGGCTEGTAPAPVPIPTMAPAGLLALVLVLLGFGLVQTGFRRA